MFLLLTAQNNLKITNKIAQIVCPPRQNSSDFHVDFDNSLNQWINWGLQNTWPMFAQFAEKYYLVGKSWINSN